MQRITIDDDLLETIDKISAQPGYSSRSKTPRDLVRNAVTHA
ncbi:Ribbon-helix-helix protein, copG family [Rhizobium miluonense]|uniref:Ribbon-helix-helix protein, copG family n=1 Tax=Rhizobium miluonense TaxID=411945 RepID=A0A1C3UR68_9HYPH|nr:Ribbon-helix-helix protein, copG family [Rhizobium miluonense]